MIKWGSFHLITLTAKMDLRWLLLYLILKWLKMDVEIIIEWLMGNLQWKDHVDTICIHWWILRYLKRRWLDSMPRDVIQQGGHSTIFEVSSLKNCSSV